MNLYPLFINIINRNKSQYNRIAFMTDDKDDKKDNKGKKKAFKDFNSSKYIDVEPTLDEEENTNEALLTRMQRRARGITMRKNRFKIKRGREKAARRMASVEILKKRARKQAIRDLKAKFAKNKRYAEMSAGEKLVIDKRISKLPASRLNAMARKLLPSVKTAERARKTHAKKESVSLTNVVDNNLNEATMWGQRQGKRPHMLLDKDNKPKFDKRFRMYKPKMEESFDDFDEILNLLETTEDYVSSEQGQEDMQSFNENARLKLINKIKNSGVVKSGSMSKDKPAPKKEAADLADLANEKIKDKKDVGEIPKDGERKFKRSKTVVDKELEKDDMEEAASRSLASIAAKNEAFGRARFSQELKRKGMDVNKMHSDNIKDAEAAKKRSAEAEKDLSDFRKKHGMKESRLPGGNKHLATAGTKATIMHPVTKVAKKVDKKDLKKHVDAGWKHMGPKRNRVEAVAESFDHTDHEDNAFAHGEAYEHHKEHGHHDLAAHHLKASDHHEKALEHYSDGNKQKGAEHARKAMSHASKAYEASLDKRGEHHQVSADAFMSSMRTMSKTPVSKVRKEEVQLDELSPETMMSYKKKADYSADRAANSAAAKILRGKDKDGNRADHSPELKTMKKRREGDRLYKTRAADKLRKALRKEATIPDGQTVFTKRPDVSDSDKDKLLKIKAMMDKERAKKNTNETLEEGPFKGVGKMMMKRKLNKANKNLAKASAANDREKENMVRNVPAGTYPIPDATSKAYNKLSDKGSDIEAKRKRIQKAKDRLSKAPVKEETYNEKYASDAQRKAVWASRNDKKNEAQVDEMDISVKSITKSGLRKVGDEPKLKADLKALRDRLNKDKGDGYGSNKSLKANYGEECGAGEQGTPALTKRLKKDTPNA